MNDGFVIIPVLFFLMGVLFLGMQLRREYAWLQYMGGFDAWFDDEDI